MRIGLQTWGTEGDVRPFVALARELSSRGHTVRLLYTSVEGRDFDALAASCGIDARAVGGEYFRDHREELERKASENFNVSNPLIQLRAIVSDLMDPVVDAGYAAARELCEESDVMVGHFLFHPTGTAAVASGRPYVMVMLQPVLPSRAYPPIGLPDLGRYVNPLLWRMAAGLIDSVLVRRINALRVRHGVAPLRGVLKDGTAGTALALAAVSPSLFTRPDDWSPNTHVSGFLAVPERAEPWEPDGALRAFLDAGPAPSFLSFGSMFGLDMQRAREAIGIMAEAVRITGTRGIIQVPASILGEMRTREDLCFVTSVPHSRLFPRCALVVHHGGAGTTQSATVAGCPSVVVPHVADQFLWGELLRQRGVAPGNLRRGDLTAARLAARMRAVISQPAMRERAVTLGASLTEERGAARAAELIETIA